jgi:hypothetical protein
LRKSIFARSLSSYAKFIVRITLLLENELAMHSAPFLLLHVAVEVSLTTHNAGSFPFTDTLSTENRFSRNETNGDGGGERAGSMVFGRSKSSSSTPAASPAAAACSKVRAAYHDCFNRWYAEKFAKGQWQRDDCADHWRKYRACLEVTHPSPPLSRLLYSYARLDSTGVTNLSVVNKDPISVFPTFCSKDTVLECRVLKLGISRLYL